MSPSDELTLASGRYEKQRRQFMPERVRILFVGESRPDQGTFFYFADSLLYETTKDAFYSAARDLLAKQNFLRSFAGLDCYLDDLCPHPVNKLPPPERDEAREAGVQPLAARIAKYQPDVVIVVLEGIARHVRRALKEARMAPEVVATLPFPTRKHRERYTTGLARLLRELRQGGYLRGPEV